LVVVVVVVVQYNIVPYDNLESFFNLKHKYMDIQYSCTNTNVKIWISKKIYHNVRTLRKSDKVSPFINGNKKLLDENMTFVDYDDGSITVKLPKLAWLFQNIIHKRIDVNVSTSRLFFISSTDTVKYNKINHLPLNSDLENYKP